MAHQGECSPWGRGTRGKLVPDETGSGEWRQRKGCFRQGKGRTGPSLNTNTHRVRVYCPCIKRKIFLFHSNSFFTSGPFFLEKPHTVIPPWPPSIPLRLEDSSSSPLIHTSSPHLFLVLANICPSPSLTNSCTV